MRPFFSLFFFFALVATLCDQVWVRLGVLVYPRAFLFGQAWWVPLLFGGVALLIIPIFAYLTRLLLPASTPVPRDPAGRAVIAGTWFVAAFLACGLFAAYPKQLALVLLVLWLLRLWPESSSIREALVLVFLTVLVALAGTLGESAMNWLHLLHYTQPNFIGVPLWLPAFWLQAALFARALARAWFWGR
jgi:hypothetical protein